SRTYSIDSGSPWRAMPSGARFRCRGKMLAMLHPSHRYDVALFLRRHDLGPSRKRPPAIRLIAALVVEPGNSRLLTADVVQDHLNDVRRETKLSDSSCNGSPEIMQPPRLQLRLGQSVIQCFLDCRKCAD